MSSAAHAALATHSVASSAPTKKVQELWREVTSGELFASALHLSPERIRSASESARDVGHGMKDVWKNLEDGVRKTLHLPALERHVSPAGRDHIADIARTVGYGVGFAGAGVLAAAGVYKLASGVRTHQKAKVLDGLVDLTAGAAVAASVAAWGPGGLVLGPAAAVVGVLRGGCNAYAGYRAGASRDEIQGFLDAGNNAVVFARLVGTHVPALGVAAIILAPIAASVQLSRGYCDLSNGIAHKSNEKKVQGLADVCAAVGLAASAFGPLAVPGVALVGLGSAVKVLYQFSPRARRRMDRVVDRATPRLEKIVARTDRVVDPVLARIRVLIERATGVKRGDEPAPVPAVPAPNASQPQASPAPAVPDQTPSGQ